MQPPRPATRHEILLVRAMMVLFVLAVSLPYLAAWRLTPAGSVWGGLLWKTFDPNVHLAWARQAQDGALCTRDLFTTEDLSTGTRAYFFNGLTWLIGNLARITGVPLILSFHLVRVAGAVWFLVEFYRLATLVFAGTKREAATRVTALALAAFAAGAGWLAVLLPPLNVTCNFLDSPTPPVFTTMPEAFAFNSAFAYPLNIVSYALLTYLFRLYLTATANTGRAHLIKIFLAALALSNIHTYDAFPLGITVALCTLWNWRDPAPGEKSAAMFRAAAVLAAGLAIPILYQLFVFRESADFRVKALVPTAPPPPLYFAETFFVTAALGAIGLAAARGEGSGNWRVLRQIAVWAVVALVSPYLPLAFGRKMIEGIHLPLSLLAAGGLIALSNQISGKLWPRLLPAMAVLVFALSPLQFLRFCWATAFDDAPSRWTDGQPPHYFLRPEWDALKAIDALPETKKQGHAVLCLWYLGAYGPRETGMTFYLSHWDETLHFTDKIGLTEGFLSGRMAPETARAFLRANRISYVIVSPFEREIGDINAPSGYDLRPVWSEGRGTTGETAVYEVEGR